jgi:hypothetical protein
MKIDFIGIGVPKAATTWISECLREHPEICMSSEKEVNFFNNDFLFKKGLSYYLKFFKNCPEKKIKGEYSTNYMCFRKSAKRIHDYFPNIKLIVSLRDPKERAYSHYKYAVQKKGRISFYKDFEDALSKDYLLIEKGFYFKQLKEYFDLFPKENILILFYIDIEEKPKRIIKRIYSFLGAKNVSFIPSSLSKKVLKSNRLSTEVRIPFLNSFLYRVDIFLSRISFLKDILTSGFIHSLGRSLIMKNKKTISSEKNTSFPPLSKEVRERLIKIYKEDIEKLEKLINKDLSCWLK